MFTHIKDWFRNDSYGKHHPYGAFHHWVSTGLGAGQCSHQGCGAAYDMLESYHKASNKVIYTEPK